MGLRFRRSIKLAPGVRLNLSGGGASVTLGPSGASVNFGSRGAHLNTGIPGTGLYSRSRLGAAPSRPSSQPGKVQVEAAVRVDDDGTVNFVDSNGEPLNSYLTNLAKRQGGDRIRQVLAEASERITQETDNYARIHFHTPSPDQTAVRSAIPFADPHPHQPLPRRLGVFARLFGKRKAIEAENEERLRTYTHDLARWEVARRLFDEREKAASEKFNHDVRADVRFMQDYLEEQLKDIVWPRETLVSFDVSDDGLFVALDVDLPEIEDLPRRIAKLPDRGYKLSIKELKSKALQEHYARHVHGIGFRVVGEVFATLPAVKQVTLSAFTQRADVTTGHLVDTYIYSVRVTREAWRKINFDRLESLDVVACFERFELSRKLSPDGSYAAITPIDA